MFIELIATLFAGLAAAGVAMLLGKVLGRRLPRWLVPVSAGAAMIGMTISMEYGWYDRTRATLPEGLEIVQPVENRALWRPWTRIAPFVDRFMAVDMATIRTHPDQPGQHMVDLLFFGRWSAVQKVPVLIDCQSARQAVLIDGMAFDDSGAVIDADWQDLEAGDPVGGLICTEPGA